MSNTNIRNRGTEERIGKSGQKFVEVDDDFRPCLLNPLIYIVRRKFGLIKRFTGA